jgi:hypothetical protein
MPGVHVIVYNYDSAPPNNLVDDITPVNQIHGLRKATGPPKQGIADNSPTKVEASASDHETSGDEKSDKYDDEDQKPAAISRMVMLDVILAILLVTGLVFMFSEDNFFIFILLKSIS